MTPSGESITVFLPRFNYKKAALPAVGFVLLQSREVTVPGSSRALWTRLCHAEQLALRLVARAQPLCSTGQHLSVCGCRPQEQSAQTPLACRSHRSKEKPSTVPPSRAEGVGDRGKQWLKGFFNALYHIHWLSCFLMSQFWTEAERTCYLRPWSGMSLNTLST